MHTTIDPEGRITLGHDLLTKLGVQPGDDVVLENRGEECLIKAAKHNSGLSWEAGVLVHRGVNMSPMTNELVSERDDRLDQLTIGLPR
ncbi:MAG: hypothetical protein ACRC8S_06200 [Fimbriiglobus sp.]